MLATAEGEASREVGGLAGERLGAELLVALANVSGVEAGGQDLQHGDPDQLGGADFGINTHVQEHLDDYVDEDHGGGLVLRGDVVAAAGRLGRNVRADVAEQV